MLFKPLTEEQRLHKCVVDILNHPRYVALTGVLMMGKKEVTDDMPTACTNGIDEFYGREFVSKLNDAELRFLILHECYHKMLRHFTTWRDIAKENPQTSNMAMDYVINGLLVEENKLDNFATMTGELVKGCYDTKYLNMDTKQVYDIIKQDQDKQGGMGGFDKHDWDKAQELTDAEVQELEEQIDGHLRQGTIMAGKTGSGGINRNIDALLEPQVRWQDQLRDFVTNKCSGKDYSTWAKPNRRFIGDGIYMPSSFSESVEELVLAGDASASCLIGQRELTLFLTEISSICRAVTPKRVRLLYWDTQVCREEIYDNNFDDITKSTKPMGGGGTLVECVPQYMSQHGIKPEATIIFTDGYLGGSFGNWNCPTLWCILNNKRCIAPIGKTIHIKN